MVMMVVLLALMSRGKSLLGPRGVLNPAVSAVTVMVVYVVVVVAVVVVAVVVVVVVVAIVVVVVVVIVACQIDHYCSIATAFDLPGKHTNYTR